MADKQSRVRRAGRALGGALGRGAMGTGVAAIAAAGVYVAQKMANQKIETAQKHPLLVPVLGLVGGHLAKNKYPNVGAGVIGASVYAGVFAWDLNRQSQAAQPAAAPAGTGMLTAPIHAGVGALTPASDLDFTPAPSNPIMGVESAMNLGQY